MFVGLDCTPFVYLIGEDRRHWQTHAGVSAGRPQELLFDEDDNVVLVTEFGPGVVSDRDLPALIEGLTENGSEVDIEELIGRLRAGEQAASSRLHSSAALQLFGEPVSAAATSRAALAQRFGYIAEPRAESDPSPDRAPGAKPVQ